MIRVAPVNAISDPTPIAAPELFDALLVREHRSSGPLAFRSMFI